MHGAISYACVAATLVLTCYGQIIMKARAPSLSERAGEDGRLAYLAAMLRDPLVLSGFVSAFLAALFWLLAIQSLPLSRAYPFIALTFVIVPLLAIPILGDSITTTQLAGMLLIVLGVALTALGR